jgi:hypothetical protein
LKQDNTILLTGLPRAGTTLSCNILNSHANVVALMEPMNPSDFSPSQGKLAAVNLIQDFALNTRQQALDHGKYPVKTIDMIGLEVIEQKGKIE